MSNKKIIIWSIVAGVFFALFLWLVIPVFATNTFYKTICHHTPGNNVTLSFNNLQSYLGHLGTPHNQQTYDTNGACQQPTPTPTGVEPTVTPTATPTPTPTIVQECDDDCDEVTPTPTPTDEPRVTPTPTEGEKGDNRGDPQTSEVKAPAPMVCTVPFEAPRVWYTKENGKVTFNWAEDTAVDKFSLTYGYSVDNLEYGVDNLPSTSRSLEINGLTHSPVFFQVQAWKLGCMEGSNIIDP